MRKQQRFIDIILEGAGFLPGMFERGGFKRGGGSSPRRKKIECLKWAILAEIMAKSAIYSHFLCQQGGVC